MKNKISILIATAALVSFMSLPALASFQFIANEENQKEYFYEISDETGETTRYSGWYELPEQGEYLYFVDGTMKTGWVVDGGKFYYMNPSNGYMAKDQKVQSFYVGDDGAALIDATAPDGSEYGYNGSLKRGKKLAEELNQKTFIITEALAKHPDAIAVFGGLDGGNPSFMKEKVDGFSFYTYKGVTLYERTQDGKAGKKLFEGDACFRTNAKIEFKQSDGRIQNIPPSALQKQEYQNFTGRVFTDPAGCIEYVKAEED